MLSSVASSISRITTMADGTVRLIVDCQEMNSEQMSELFKLNKALGYFFFSPNVIKEIPADLPEIDIEAGEKHPSKRLHSVLYILWKQSKSTHPFELFYRTRMEELIEMIKHKLI